MCRLIAIINEEEKGISEALPKFRALSINGVVPPHTDPGHRDGWGIAAYRGGEILFLEKNPKPAAEDPRYEVALERTLKEKPSLVLGHLRKASVGSVKSENTQPYQLDPYVFCHNGKVSDYAKLELKPEYLKLKKGDTDSEIVFLFLVQTIREKGNVVGGFLEVAKRLRTMDYTAVNLLFSDGKAFIAMKEVNEENEGVKKMNLCDSYYTLFQGKDVSGATKFVCSEPLEVPGISWIPIANHQIVVIDVTTEKEQIMQ